MKYALSCVRRMGLALCGASPAMPTYVDGVGRIDLCARHAVEASGIGKPIQAPSDRAQHSRKPDRILPAARAILAYIAEHPGCIQSAIAEGTGFHKATVSAWTLKLVANGYLRREGKRSSPIPPKFWAIALPRED